MNVVKEKKRVARIGKLTNEYLGGDPTPIDCLNVLDILKGMDESHSKKNILSFQQLEELRSQKRKASNVNEVDPNRRHIPPKSLKRILPEKTFPLMAKCQKSLSIIKHNRSIPKPRAHVGFVKTPKQPVSSEKKDIFDLVPETSTVQSKKCERKTKKSKKSNIPKKTADLNVSVQKMTPECKSKGSNDSTDESDSGYEKFLKTHRHAFKLGDKLQSDSNFNIGHKKNKKWKKIKNIHESGCIEQPSKTMSKCPKKPEQLPEPAREKKNKRKRGKIPSKKISDLSIPVSEDTDFSVGESQYKKKVKRKNETHSRHVLSKVTSIPLKSSDESSNSSRTSLKACKETNLNDKSDPDIPVWSYGCDINTSDSEDLDNIGSKFTSKSRNLNFQNKANSLGKTSDRNDVPSVHNSIENKTNYAHCYVLLKRDPFIEKKVLCHSVSSFNRCSDKISSKTRSSVDTQDDQPLTPILSSSTPVEISECIEDLPSIDEDDCIFVCENPTQNLQEERLKTESQPEQNLSRVQVYKQFKVSLGTENESTLISDTKHVGTSAIDSEIEDCTIIEEKREPERISHDLGSLSLKTNNDPTAILTSSDNVVPLGNSQESKFSSYGQNFSSDAEAEFNLQIISVESISILKDVEENCVKQNSPLILSNSNLTESSDSDVEIIGDKSCELGNNQSVKTKYTTSAIGEKPNSKIPSTTDHGLLNSFDDDDCLILSEKVASEILTDNNGSVNQVKNFVVNQESIPTVERRSVGQENKNHTSTQSLLIEKEAERSTPNNTSQIPVNIPENYVNVKPDPKILEILKTIDFDCIKKIINSSNLNENECQVSSAGPRTAVDENLQSNSLNLKTQSNSTCDNRVKLNNQSLKESILEKENDNIKPVSNENTRPLKKETLIPEIILDEAAPSIEDQVVNKSFKDTSVKSSILIQQKVNQPSIANELTSNPVTNQPSNREQFLKEKSISEASITSTIENVSITPETDRLYSCEPMRSSTSNKKTVHTSNNAHHQENKVCCIVKEEKDYKIERNVDNMSDELDATATSLIFNLEKQNNKSVTPLLDLYKKEYKKYRDILSTEKNVSAGLRLLQENQARKLSHICSSITNLVKRDPCLYKVAKYEKDINEDLKSVVSQESTMPCDYETCSSMPSEMVEKCSSSTNIKKELTKEQSVSQTILRCANCEKPATGMCLGCKKVYYCSNNCGEISWNQGHSLVCRGGC